MGFIFWFFVAYLFSFAAAAAAMKLMRRWTLIIMANNDKYRNLDKMEIKTS